MLPSRPCLHHPHRIWYTCIGPVSSRVSEGLSVILAKRLHVENAPEAIAMVGGIFIRNVRGENPGSGARCWKTCTYLLYVGIQRCRESRRLICFHSIRKYIFKPRWLFSMCTSSVENLVIGKHSLL